MVPWPRAPDATAGITCAETHAPIPHADFDANTGSSRGVSGSFLRRPELVLEGIWSRNRVRLFLPCLPYGGGGDRARSAGFQVP